MAVVMALKKHSARSGRRVVKDDVARLNAIRRDEIVDVIVENLRPWKKHNSRDTITTAVNHQIDWLLKWVPLQKKLFDPRPGREHAEKLGKALSRVEMLLLSSPEPLSWFLFDQRPRSMPLNDDGSPSVQPMPHKSIEEIEREHKALVGAFVMELRRLRKVCAGNYGLHPNYDHAKNLSAECAHALMRELSDQKITGTEDGAFRTISGLLYEVISGQQDVDLKRACDALLAFMKPPLPPQTLD
jgi:hypothetical protein